MSSGCPDEQCGADLDRVARRLATAAAARRAHYEREAAARALAAATAPALDTETYRLAASRECVRATDGCDYTISSDTEPKQPNTRCGPNREPPPPRPVELAPTDACEISRGRRLDPCAHHPRILLEIDRSSTGPPSKEPVENNSNASKTSSIFSSTSCPPSKVRLTTRIIESLNLKRESKGSCAKSKCATHYTENKMPSWCSNPPKPVAVPAGCTKPSIVEQLRRRPGGTIGRRCSDAGSSTRCMHTSTPLMRSDKTCKAPTDSTTTSVGQDQVKKGAGIKLEKVLQERSQHKEIARGRVVTPDGQPGGAAPGAGQLELRVPPAAESVRVRVSLHFIPLQAGNSLVPMGVTASTNSKISNCTRSLSSVNDDSWLSIRGIQKKWSGYCKNNKPPAGGKSVPDSKSRMEPSCSKKPPPVHPRCGPPQVSSTSNKKTCNNVSKSPKSKKEPEPKPTCGCPPGKNIRRVSSAPELTPTILF